MSGAGRQERLRRRRDPQRSPGIHQTIRPSLPGQPGPVNSLWNDTDAQACIERYARTCSAELALRVYTSRLIGREPGLVLHGGGNTSVKTTLRDALGEELEVLCVKGSGSDLAEVEPAGLPAVELAPLVRLRALDRLSDEEMVNQVRRRLLDSTAPNPSVETLLHAFLPETFVDHTHADAILVLTNQPDGAVRIREALGPRVAVLPWTMPGFPLAKAVADAYERQRDLEGIVLLQHGIFTFGPDAKTSYERMIALVDRAERYAARRAGAQPPRTAPPEGLDDAAAARALEQVAPVVRGALAFEGRRWIAEWRGAEDVRALSAHANARQLFATGPLTPDHVIRTKGPYLVVSEAEAGSGEAMRRAVDAYAERYTQYFQAHRGRVARPPRMLDPRPRVVVIEGLGLVAYGPDKRAARIAADIAVHTLRGKVLAEGVGRYVDLPPGDLFEMEYWSLEQAKLGKAKPAPLAGQVALVTGAGGAIGYGICDALLGAGAHVVLTDRDATALENALDKLGMRHGAAQLNGAVVDVTDEASVRDGFRHACRHFGGVDIVVPNAGIAYAAALAEIDPQRFRRTLDVNLTGTMLVLRAAQAVFAAQGTGGSVVIQASKNVFDPGAGFGAYSASKAGAHQLGKIAALEFAPLGVRVNMINADAVFGDEVPSGLWAEVGPERMKARGLDAEGLRDFYRQRSLLKVEVTPAHVGAAVVFFATGATPTTGATLPVDGGIPGAFPR
ncbi:MAG: bifunctional aldolase/short-chain dehydrogenase [Planctomycetes bacterium]|nr:bifunctional aldolase/short-chain dehydrogenase [Planctomycetota bacterium]